jgi:hypothetical protein
LWSYCLAVLFPCPPPRSASTQTVNYASVALGAFSELVFVHPHFQLIVVLPVNMRAPAPFFNRFEKYLVSAGSVLASMLGSQRFNLEQQAAVQSVLESAKELVAHIGQADGGGISGYVAEGDATLQSIVVSALVRALQREHFIKRLLDLARLLLSHTSTAALSPGVYTSIRLSPLFHSCLRCGVWCLPLVVGVHVWICSLRSR